MHIGSYNGEKYEAAAGVWFIRGGCGRVGSPHSICGWLLIPRLVLILVQWGRVFICGCQKWEV